MFYLAKKLDASIIGYGKESSAHEHAIKSFTFDANITVFCWTEPHRLYHTTLGINMKSAIRYAEVEPAMKAAVDYYKYIHNKEYAEERQIRDLYWFDNEVLSHYKGKIIHFFSMSQILYEFRNGYTNNIPLNNIFNAGRRPCRPSDNKNFFNHLSRDDNKKLAQLTFKLLQY